MLRIADDGPTRPPTRLPRGRLATVVVIATLCSTACSTPSALAQYGPAPVRAAEIVEADVSAPRSFVGTVEPTRTSTVGCPVEGRVVEYLVDEGQRVSEDQPLVRLRSRGIDLEIRVAEAELELRRRELRELENGSRPGEVDESRAALEAAVAEREYAATELERKRAMAERATGTVAELDAAVQRHRRAVALERAARARLALVEEGPRAEAIEQARQRIAIQEEVIARLSDRLAEHTVLAPFDGHVVAEHTERGQWLGRGDPVVELAVLDEVHVVAAVPEEYIRHLSIGMSARIEFGALPGEAFTGRVDVILPQADPRSRTFPVKIRVQNRIADGQPTIRAGLFARATLGVGEVGQAMLVPKDALVLSGSRASLYVIDPDPAAGPAAGKVRLVPVTLGVADAGLIQVHGEGLAAGQRVVTLGNERLRPGMAVAILPEGQGR